jgi:hypothetical protein
MNKTSSTIFIIIVTIVMLIFSLLINSMISLIFVSILGISALIYLHNEDIQRKMNNLF